LVVAVFLRREGRLASSTHGHPMGIIGGERRKAALSAAWPVAGDT